MKRRLFLVFALVFAVASFNDAYAEQDSNEDPDTELADDDYDDGEEEPSAGNAQISLQTTNDQLKKAQGTGTVKQK